MTPAPPTATTEGGKRSHRKAMKMPASRIKPMTARCAAMKSARSSTRPLSALRPVEQLVVGEDERHHRLDDRRAADADAGVVASLGDDVGRLAGAVDRRD